MMIIMLVIIIMFLPRSVCPTTRSASSGPAAPLVTAWRPLSPASSSGYLAHLVLKYIQDLFLRRFICKSWQKLAFLAACLLLSGVFGLLVPLISSFPLLLPALLGAGFFIGSYNTANNSLVVYMLGPDK